MHEVQSLRSLRTPAFVSVDGDLATFIVAQGGLEVCDGAHSSFVRVSEFFWYIRVSA